MKTYYKDIIDYVKATKDVAQNKLKTLVSFVFDVADVPATYDDKDYAQKHVRRIIDGICVCKDVKTLGKHFLNDTANGDIKQLLTDSNVEYYIDEEICFGFKKI